MKKRYEVVNESVSYHCCFVATVIDTTITEKFASQTVCECFELEHAQKIADALNSAEDRKQ